MLCDVSAKGLLGSIAAAARLAISRPNCSDRRFWFGCILRTTVKQCCSRAGQQWYVSNRFGANGRRNYAAKFDINAHNAAEWDALIHADIVDRVALVLRD